MNSGVGAHERLEQTETLLDWVAVVGVARVDRLAAGKAFVLAVVETDVIFAQAPAEVDVLAVHARGEIEQAYVDVLHDAAGGMDSIQGALNGGRQAIGFDPLLCGFFVGNEQTAGTVDAFAERAELLLDFRKLPAADSIASIRIGSIWTRRSSASRREKSLESSSGILFGAHCTSVSRGEGKANLSASAGALRI